MLNRGRQSVTLPSGCAPTDTAPDAVGPHCCQSCCWVTTSSLPTRTSRAFPMQLLPTQAALVCVTARDTSFSGVGLVICAYWTSLSHYRPIPLDCLHPSWHQPCPWAYQLAPPKCGVTLKLHEEALGHFLQSDKGIKQAPSCFLWVSRHLQCKTLGWDFGSTT